MFISDLRPRTKSLGDAIRKHRGIENGQHWVLDVSFHEDTARQQDRHGSANLGAVRRLVVSLLRQEKTLRRGAKAKRMVCTSMLTTSSKCWPPLKSMRRPRFLGYAPRRFRADK